MFSNLEFLDYRFTTEETGSLFPISWYKDVVVSGGDDSKRERKSSNSQLLRSKSLKKRPKPDFDNSGPPLGNFFPFNTSKKKQKLVGQPSSYIMSGELQIVFIYDTLSVRKEEDDPKDAILYFHPDCIPEERRIAICGQLMGITHFLLDTFSAPKILTLDNGKFAMRKFGRQYVLALGCSSVTPDWLLEKQADILYNLTIFFHRDIKSILSAVKGDPVALTSRLSLVMDHYIPISQHHGDLFALTFGILPILNLPKSASNISLRATVVLQSCLMLNGVLGGIVMYQNKVIGVEIAQELAQKLAFIQPYQLPPAEPVRLSFACPPGVQLFAVYVSEQELDLLRKHCATLQRPSHCEPKIVKPKENNNKGKIDPIREEEDPSDISSLGFSEPLSSKSISNGSHAEELDASLAETSSEDTGKGGSRKGTSSSTEPPPTIISTNSNLKFEEYLKTASTKCKLEATVVDQNHSHTKDKNSSTGTATNGEKKENLVALPPPCVHMNGCGPNSLNSGRTFKSLENLQITDDNSADKSTPPPLMGRCLCASLTDPFFPFIRCDGKSISKALLDIYAAATDDHLNHDNQEDEEDKENDLEVEAQPSNEQDDKEMSSNEPFTHRECKDAPLPNQILNGSLSETQDDTGRLNEPLLKKPNDLNTSSPASLEQSNSLEETTPTSAAPRRPMDLPLNNKKFNRKKSKRRWSTFEDMMSPVVDTPSRVVSDSFPAVIPNVNENWKNSAAVVTNETAPSINPSHQELFTSFRKLSSQDELHNTSSSTDNTLKFNGSIPSSSSTSHSTLSHKNPSKQITLHPSEKLQSCSVSSSISTTVTKEKNKNPTLIQIPLAKERKFGNEGRSIGSGVSSSTKNFIKSSLFIYSLGSMRLLLILEDERREDQELIQTLWEYGSSSLSALETAISNVEEQTMSTTASQHDHYCYLHYEAVWRSLAHGGRNHSMDFDVVQQMHQDFNVYPNISELIIRGEDHVVYGYQCVGSEVFYQQSAGLQPGLPMPSDLMGKVPFKAKRRLERDHNILLL